MAPSFLDQALEYADRGWHVLVLHNPTGDEQFPCSCRKPVTKDPENPKRPICSTPAKHPRTENGEKDATTDPALIREWAKLYPHANLGIWLPPSGLAVVGPDSRQWYETFQNLGLPPTARAQTGGGEYHEHFLYQRPEHCPEARLCRSGEYDVLTGGYIVAPPSRHVSGRRYEWLVEPGLFPNLRELPDWAMEMLIAAKEKRLPTAPARQPRETRPDLSGLDYYQGYRSKLTPDGEVDRSATLMAIGTELARVGLSEGEIEEEVSDRDIALNFLKYADRGERGRGEYRRIAEKAVRLVGPVTVYKNGSHPPQARKTETSVVSVVSVVKDVTTFAPKPPEELEPEALHGLPGAILAAIGPHTESHPAALLGSFIAIGGCALGRGPHVYRDGARHAGNEFCNLVGLSGVSRKGTATRRIDELIELCQADYSDPSFDNNTLYNNNNKYNKLTTCMGLGSGEALVASLCEMQEDGELPDRRLVVKEEEFARVLKVMRREGSTLSENLRSAWDSGTLANRTKGKLLEVKDAHVSVLGHITEHELREQLSGASLFNGFANRFLWFCTKRARSLPFGGGDPPLGPIVSRLHQALAAAGRPRRVEFDQQVSRIWAEGGLYERLIDRPPGLLGAVTSRAEAHVTRTALQYAVWDCEASIRVPHLLAALAVWDYNEKSCAYIFGTLTGSDYADQLDEWLREVYPGFLTRKEIRDFYQRNVKAGLIEEALLLLERLGRAVRGKMPTAGRSAETWQHNPFTTYDRNDGNDRSPLEMARCLVQEWGFQS